MENKSLTQDNLRSGFLNDWDSFFNDLASPFPLARRGDFATRGNFPATDVEETEDSYILKMDVPSVKEKDIEIELRENTLHVSGERNIENKGKGRIERFTGSFHRAFTLPNDVNAEGIDANLKDGELSITLPREEKASSKKIDIKS